MDSRCEPHRKSRGSQKAAAIATVAARAARAAAAARAAKHLAVEKGEIQRPLDVSEEPFHDSSLHLLSIKGKKPPSQRW